MATRRSGGTSRSKKSVGHGSISGSGRKGDRESEDKRRVKSSVLSPKKLVGRFIGKVRSRAAQEYIQPKSRLFRRDSFGRFIRRKLVRVARPAARKGKAPVRKVEKPVKPAKPSKILKGLAKSSKTLKRLVKKTTEKPAQKWIKSVRPEKPIRKPVKKLVKKPARKPVKPVKPSKVRRRPAKKPPQKFPKKPKKIPKKLPRRRRKKKPRVSVPPLPVAAGEADMLMQQKLQEVMDLMLMMFSGASTSIKTAINADWSVDGELRLDGLPEELRTEEGMLEIVALVSESFRAFRPFDQIPSMGGKFWLSFGVRFGPNNESQAKELADLYKRFRGMFQVGTYPVYAWSLGSIQAAIAPGGLRTIFEGVARKVGLPPSTLLIRFIWTPGPKKLWREFTRSQQYTQRPGHYDHEGGKEKLK